jgi:Peptidase family S41
MVAVSGAILLCPRRKNKFSAFMFLRSIFLAPFICCSLFVAAQSPSPSASPANAQALIDSLAPAEIDEAVRALKSNFVDPNALKDQEITRATLQGLLARLRGGVVLLPGKTTPETAAPFYSEVLANHIGYARPGSLTKENVADLDKALANFAGKKVDAVVVDLRASAAAGEFDVAAEMAKRFVPKGKTMWTLHKASARQDQPFTNDRDPVFQGLTIGLIDEETSGAAEAVAAALKMKGQTLLIGATSAGRAVEYSDFPLSSGKILRVAVGEVIGPDGQSLFPGGVKPDLPVELAPAQKRQIFSGSAQRGMTPFVFEPERPHFNEAALIAGTNPELDARRRNPEESPHDAVLQRAVDVITSLAVFQKH